MQLGTLAVWPAVRHDEADQAAQIRQALGTGRFDEVHAAGARLNRRDALAAALRAHRHPVQVGGAERAGHQRV